MITHTLTCAMHAHTTYTRVSPSSQVPTPIVDNWLWRRGRNHEASQTLLLFLSLSSSSIFKYAYITLDDAAEYGFNVGKGVDGCVFCVEVAHIRDIF